MTVIMSPLFAQDKLSEEQIKAIAGQMENDWRFGRPIVMWMESESNLDYYLTTADQRCPEELEFVLELAEPSYKDCLQILRLQKQIYRKPGARKWEASLAKYFPDTDSARKRFASAADVVQMYEKLEKKLLPLIESKRSQTYNVPQGDLVGFVYRSGGGMVRRPPTYGELRRLEDGNYIALLDTDTFEKLDTVAVSKAQAAEIRALLIEGEVYKMPRYYDSPVLLLDGPTHSVSVDFTDGSFSCYGFPPSEWGGKNILAVYNYLRRLHPLQ